MKRKGIPMSRKRIAIAFLVTCVLLLGGIAAGIADITLTLSNDFIETYKRRATISGSFKVSHAHESPNTIGTGSNDGDMHIAGSCTTVGLPMVAEIMNAAKHPDCVTFVRQLDDATSPADMTTDVTGVWRLWFEHPGSTNQVQFGSNVIHPDNTNPDHVFEIHPITQFGQFALLDTLVPIKSATTEFSYKPAADAFTAFKAKNFEVQPDGDTKTKLTSGQIGYNYVKFRVAKLPDSTFEVEDGTFMYVSVYKMTGSTRLRRKCRIVLVGGSAAQTALRDAAVGVKVKVIGIPRVSLSLVAWRRAHPEARQWKLPYEMVIVGLV